MCVEEEGGGGGLENEEMNTGTVYLCGEIVDWDLVWRGDKA